jgi:hypothetical protein
MKAALPLILVITVLFAAGCASAANPTSRADRGRGGIIDVEEIRAANVENVLELVRARRPAWLRIRGTMTMENDAGIIVYMDQARIGGVEGMRHIHPQTVTSITFLDAAAANYRFGQGHMHGAIVISTRPEQ